LFSAFSKPADDAICFENALGRQLIASNALATVSNLRGGHFGPICSSFLRLERDIYEFTA